MALLTGMVAGSMVFSSFVAPKQDLKCESSETIMNDDGWENWTKVDAVPYSNNHGQWEKDYGSSYRGLQVQRRAWCGDVQYRVLVSGTPYSVTKSPTDDYPYCFYKDGRAFCFYM